MPSITMADFRPHLPSDSETREPGSTRPLHQVASDGPAAAQAAATQAAAAQPPTAGQAAPQTAAAIPPPAPAADPEAEAKRLAEARRLLRQVFVLAVMLDLLGGAPSPAGRRRRPARGG